MKIYIAGAIQGNLKPMYKTAADCLESGLSYKEGMATAMKAFLAGLGGKYFIPWMIKEKGEQYQDF